MIIDLHSHYLPVDVLRGLDDIPVHVENGAEESVRLSIGDHSVIAHNSLFDLELQRADMRRAGLEKRALMVPPFCLLYELPNDQGVRWARVLNDAIAAVSSRSGDFVGFATVPLQDIESATGELDRAVSELGLQGVEIATSINGTGLDEPSLDSFWSKCESLSLPILIHPHYVSGATRMSGYHLRNLVGNPAETALAGARLLFSGVLERFPKLRIILSHGGGALPHIVGRLEHGFEVRPECREHAQDPIGSLGKLYYDTVVFDHTVLRHLIEHVGASQLVLGTDYPFDMSEANPVQFVKQSGLLSSDIDGILNNSSRLLQGVSLERSS